MNAKYIRAITFTVGTCLVLAGVGAFAFRTAAQARSDESDFTAVDALITARMGAAHIPGLSVAIVKGDQIVYLKGYGQVDPSGRPVTPQTPFIIGSISKTFTALAVMQLVASGKVELDAPVQRYLPWFRVADPQASARSRSAACSITPAAFPQVTATFLWTDQDAGVLERSVRYLKTVALARPVGTFGYSNANYQILGLIVRSCRASRMKPMSSNTFSPPSTCKQVSPRSSKRSSMEWPRGTGGGSGYPSPPPCRISRAELPAGYLVSSAQDMAHYLMAN